jgi:hypothetical protein
MSGARRLVLSGTALTVLLAVVAVASHAHRPGGGSGGGTADTPRLVVEYAASAIFVLFPFAVLVVLWVLSIGRRQKLLEGSGSARRQVLGLLVLVLLAVPAALALRLFLDNSDGGQQPFGTGATAPQGVTTAERHSGSTHFHWLPALLVGSIVFAVVVGLVAAVIWKRRRGADWEREAAQIAALDEVLADTLNDLRAERDPRRAVIAAFARMEKTFAGHRVAREAAETPREYVERALDRLGVSVSSVRQLTSLYERAKFSRLAIDDSMKRDAIDALAGLRAELEPEAQAAA